MATVGITGQRGGGSRVKGNEVIASHSAGSAGMTDHGIKTLGDGKQYRLLEVKQSGTITFDPTQVIKGILADLCIVDGGYGGGSGGYNGGNGGKMLNFYKLLLANLTVVIGAGGIGRAAGSAGQPVAGGDSSVVRSGIDDASSSASLKASGSGTGGGQGGTASSGVAGTGDGLTKYPFSDSSYFSPHCGGAGGGASTNDQTSTYVSGGNGAANGGNGSNRVTASVSTVKGGNAGDSSAGAGGKSSAVPAEAGKYYGGGGGGGAVNVSETGTATIRAGANGYQGVVWIRIPA